jgi:hypothetical protein
MADDEFNEQDFYDHAKKAETFFANDVSRRHHRAALKDFLHWMDRSGASRQEGVSPGAKAASKAAVPDAQTRELDGRIKLVDDKPAAQQDEAIPVEDQPKGFEEAAGKAHDIFMTAVGKTKND